MKNNLTRQERREEIRNREWKRTHRFCMHHITNRVNGGGSEPSNLLLFDREREKAFHFIFGNKSFEEAAELLLRTCRAKKR